MGQRKSSLRFVICLRNDDCPDLELRKVYQVLSDNVAAADGLIRITDETGEDYLYPEEYFIQIDLPATVEKALLSAA